MWGNMTDVQTKEITGMIRSRYDRDKIAKSVAWDIKTPTIDELTRLGAGLEQVSSELYAPFGDLWDRDPGVEAYKQAHGIF